MPLKVIANGATKDAASAKAVVGNAQKRVTRIDAWNGSAWKVAQSFATSLTLSVTPTASGTGASSGVVTVSSSTATATPTGGVAPFTYAWTKTSGDTLTVNSPTNASTTFSAAVGPEEIKGATYLCTATDSLGSTATGSVNVIITNNGA